MPDGKKRREVIVRCEDCNCRFRLQKRRNEKLPDECIFENDEAVMFLRKYGVTTCDVGMGYKTIDSDTEDNKKIKMKLRYKGRI